MQSISARAPDDLEEELKTFIDEERLDTSTAIRKLLSEGLDKWRTEQTLEHLKRGEVSLNKAAERAGVDTWELARLAQKRDITWVGDDHLESDLGNL